MPSSPRVAIVHEWLTSMRGGEKCVEVLCELYPEATLFALLHAPGSVSPVLERMPPRTSFLQNVPGIHRTYRHYLPLFPAAVRSFDLRDYDLVITSHHCVAKGVRVRPGALHICYCHTPMRYLWDQYDEYFSRGRAGVLTRLGMALASGPLRRWDVRTASSPHHFIANSRNVQDRIRTIYERSSTVIYPPVDTGHHRLSTREGTFYLVVSALVPYKRVDLAIEACRLAGERLVIVGDGPDQRRLRRIAGEETTFAGRVSDDELRELYAGCRALLFPGEEDFGIVPLEAMATGKPVVALARGGALETVLDGDPERTGILFREQTPGALRDAMVRCRSTAFDPGLLRRHALRFDREVFKSMIRDFVDRALEAHREGRSPTTI